MSFKSLEDELQNAQKTSLEPLYYYSLLGFIYLLYFS